MYTCEFCALVMDEYNGWMIIDIIVHSLSGSEINSFHIFSAPSDYLSGVMMRIPVSTDERCQAFMRSIDLNQ